MAPDGDWVNTFQTLFGSLLGDSRESYSLIPSMVWRIQRCSPADISALINAWKLVSGGPTRRRSFMDMAAHTHGYAAEDLSSYVREVPAEKACDMSTAILYNMFLSDAAKAPPPSFDEIRSIVRTQIFGGPLAISKDALELWHAWPRYATDSYWHKNTNRTRPLLFVNGDLDISTPWANSAYESLFFDRPNVWLVRLPGVPHVGFLISPVDNSPVPCGLQIITSFYLSGGVSIDDSCISHILPLDWKGDTTAVQEKSQMVYGTPDPWQF